MLVSLIFFVIWSVRVRGIYSLCIVGCGGVKMVFFLFCFLIGRIILFCCGRVFTWWMFGLRVAPSLWESVLGVNCDFGDC